MTKRELMTDAEAEALEKAHGVTYAAWELYGRWLDAYRAAHPEDRRDELELTYVYADWPDDAEIGVVP